MFMAEMESPLLTAGHDLDTLREELPVEVASGDQQYTLLNSQR